MDSTKIKYILYARKSSESEDKQVASIESQINELKKLAKQNNIKIYKILKEEKSAKAPGRPIFGEMIKIINEGNANGILCWKLDRLARNPVDGGTIGWLLQNSVISHIQTYQRSYFPNDNVLMMNLEFGMANQFILDLSSNTKRGMRNKVEKGWYPHKPPIGYLNNKYKNPAYPEIYPDPEKFPLLRKLWRLLIDKHYSVDKIYDIALKMKLTNTKGGKLVRNTFYRTFHNPFYYGSFVWNDQIYSGNHEPMITKEEFDFVQNLIENRYSPMKKKHEFAYTGLIRCGSCGAFITAEEKIKRQKNGNVHRYTYYRCTRRVDKYCKEPAISVQELEEQVDEILEKINIPPQFHSWAIKQLREEHAKEKIDREQIKFAYQKNLKKCEKKLDILFEMRLNDEINSDEFSKRKKKLIIEKKKFEELISDQNHRIETWFNRAEELFDIAEKAREKFKNGTLEEKKAILSCLGSNLVLKDKKLSLELNKSLILFKDISKEVKKLHNRLEPLQVHDSKIDWDSIYGENINWGE